MDHTTQEKSEITTPEAREPHTVAGVNSPLSTATLLFSKLLRPAKGPDELGRLANFKVIRLLGQGGMGVVFEAVDEQLKRAVALKVLQPDSQADVKSRERFLEEARACAALRHDHIVPLFQVGEDNGVIFLAMPLLRGMPLDRWVKKQQPHLMQILRIGREAADGLAAAHAQGIVHRDIKLANIWLEAPKGRVVLLDFGLAGRTETSFRGEGKNECVGTSGYIAPEQISGAEVDHRADIFSLGVVLYRLATQQMPFPGSELLLSYYESLKSHKPTPPHEINPAIPPGLSDWILAMLARKPKNRPETAKQVRNLLQEFQDAEVQKEVDRQGSPQDLLKQSVIILEDSETSDQPASSSHHDVSLTSYFVAQPRRQLRYAVLALGLMIGAILAMGMWIYHTPLDSEESTRPMSSTTVNRHINARKLVEQTGTVTSREVKEASALIKSRKHPGIFYTLCDANNPNHVYAIDVKGKLHATLELPGVLNIDWEALTMDRDGNLYVGDIGNNLMRHKERHIYRVAEPDQFTRGDPEKPQKVEITGTWTFTYPKRLYDAESLLLADGQFWIITKARNLGETRLFRLPVDAEGKKTPLTEVGVLSKDLMMIADASLSDDHKQLALVNKFFAVVYSLPNGKVEDILTSEPMYYEFDLFKVEGCAWDGPDLRMIAEDRKVYRLPLK